MLARCRLNSYCNIWNWSLSISRSIYTRLCNVKNKMNVKLSKDLSACKYICLNGLSTKQRADKNDWLTESAQQGLPSLKVIP